MECTKLHEVLATFTDLGVTAVVGVTGRDVTRAERFEGSRHTGRLTCVTRPLRHVIEITPVFRFRNTGGKLYWMCSVIINVETQTDESFLWFLLI